MTEGRYASSLAQSFVCFIRPKLRLIRSVGVADMFIGERTWARSLARLERSAHNRVVEGSNPSGPIQVI